MYQATFDKHEFIHHKDKKRVGQPRKKWLQETMYNLYETHVKPYKDDDEDFNEFDQEHIRDLKEVAKARPF